MQVRVKTQNIWKLKQEELKEEGEAGVPFLVPLEC